MKQPYPKIISEKPSDLATVLRRIVQLRGDDISDYQMLTNLLAPFSKQLPNYLDDNAAKAGGVPINGFYRNGNIVQQRLT